MGKLENEIKTDEKNKFKSDIISLKLKMDLLKKGKIIFFLFFASIFLFFLISTNFYNIFLKEKLEIETLKIELKGMKNNLEILKNKMENFHIKSNLEIGKMKKNIKFLKKENLILQKSKDKEFHKKYKKIKNLIKEKIENKKIKKFIKKNKRYLNQYLKTDHSPLYLSINSDNEEIIKFLIKEKILFNKFDFIKKNNNKLDYQKILKKYKRKNIKNIFFDFALKKNSVKFLKKIFPNNFLLNYITNDFRKLI